MTEQAIIQTTIDQYLSAWNETDAAARQTILQDAWGKSATYTDPLNHATTLDALNAVISQFVADTPDAVFTLKGEVSHHHQSCRFYWTLRFANGVEVEGMDYGEIDAEGKLTRIVGFF